MSGRSRAGAWRCGPRFLRVTWPVPGVAVAAAEAAPAPAHSPGPDPSPAPAPLPAPLPARLPDSSAVRHGPPPPLPGPHPRPHGAHPQRGPRSRAAGASPQACSGGDGPVLQSWEHLLPAGFREEGVSSCPGCWGELFLSCLSRDSPVRGGVGGRAWSCPARRNPVPEWGWWGFPHPACWGQSPAPGGRA